MAVFHGSVSISSDRSNPPALDASPPARPVFYGRRQGRRLRPHRAQLWDTLLPNLRVVVPAGSARIDPRSLFAPPISDVWLEIGFGGGEHIAAQAEANPQVGLIGAEPFVNGVATLLANIDERPLTNIRIFPDDVRLLLAAIEDVSIARAFILFPDPWPKLRHHRRRIVGPQTLDALARILVDGAELRLATDHPGYVQWMLWHLIRHPAFAWRARSPTDWRQRPADWPETRYEAKALAEGKSCTFLTFERVARQGVGRP